MNVADILTFNMVFGKHTGYAGFSPRLDLNASGIINVSDVLQLNAFMFKRCT